ncbi:hypothetical protein M8J77_015233 [Diaphorina citri]|nr:hypothetical protein M8J77_015233 [Diaphorina citri]
MKNTIITSLASRLADERDEIRKTNPLDPRIQELNNEIGKLVDEHRIKKWQEHLEQASFTNKGHHNLWKTIKNIVNPNKSNPNNAINFNNVPVDNPKKCSKLFNTQFTEHPTAKDKTQRRTRRQFQSYSSLNKRNSQNTLQIPNTETEIAIKKVRPSKAIGPDGISAIMIKHLGPKSTEYLTKLFNLSLKTLAIPDIWKTARIIPLLKPGKDANDSKSFRPISLLSPVAKLLESILLPCITDNITLAEHQHGFRKNFSTTTALHMLQNQISNGLNQERPCERSIMVALDLSKAFDSISIEILLEDLLNTDIPWTVKRWLFSYMRGRSTYVDFRNTKSASRSMKQGVPQGGVLSPTLFNIYLSKIPAPPEDITLISYADDCTILATGHNITELSTKINEYLSTLNAWFTQRKLKLSPGKSSATLFTTWTKEVNTQLDIKINDQRLPTIKNPKILGLTFDPLLTFNQHATTIRNKLKPRNNMLKALTGNNWGKNKETIITTFKALGRSVMNYAAPIWSPQLSQTHWDNLQICQNAALRVATGSHKMAHADHLHNETKILPVKIHNELLSQQYLLACHHSNHPCKTIVQKPPPPRYIRRTVQHLKHKIQDILVPDIDTPTCKILNKVIHTRVVENAIQSYKPNKVLNTAPPDISPDEKKLPRTTRSALSQYRSGWSRRLNSYMHRINPSIEDKCNQCSQSPHDTPHLFNCPGRPTTLTVIDLWQNPIATAEFLELPTALPG